MMILSSNPVLAKGTIGTNPGEACQGDGNIDFAPELVTAVDPKVQALKNALQCGELLRAIALTKAIQAGLAELAKKQGLTPAAISIDSVDNIVE